MIFNTQDENKETPHKNLFVFTPLHRVKREAEEMLYMVRQEFEDLYSDKSKEKQGREDELNRIEIPVG